MVTYSFVVDNTATVPVVAQSYAHSITIMENDQTGSTDYYVYAPTASNAQITRPAGSQTEFRPTGPSLISPFYSPGQIIGYVKTVTGSITMIQVEN